MFSFVSKSFSDNFKGFAISNGLCGLFKTLDVRIAHYDPSSDPAHPDFTTPCIWVFWHEYIFCPIALWQRCDVTMLVSQHRDGNWLTEAAERMGFLSVRGSSTRGGSEAIRQLKRLSNSCGVGITPDGPRGPRREMALGPVYLASRLQMPLVVTGIGYQEPWRMRTWDSFAIPKPGQRVRIIMGDRMMIPQKLKRDGLERYRNQIQSQLDLVTETAENWASGNFRMQNEMPFRRQPNRNWRQSDRVNSIETQVADKQPTTLPRAA